MGIDACIYFKVRSKDDEAMPYLTVPDATIFETKPDYCPDDADFWVDNGRRYYSPDYARGPWPMIAATLMTLLAHPNVETVWYFGDTDGYGHPITADIVLEYSAFYMQNGNRPYFGGR